MVRRHHGGGTAQQPKIQDYIKYPMETRFFVVENALNAEGYNIMYKDWDTGRMDDFKVVAGGANMGTYHTRRIGEYEFTLENWKMRYRHEGAGGGSAYKQYILTQDIIDRANLGTDVDTIDIRDGMYSYADTMDQCNYSIAKYLHKIRVYPDRRFENFVSDNMYATDSPSHRKLNINRETKVFYEDENTLSFYCDYGSAARQTISFDRMPDGDITMVYSWNMPVAGEATELAIETMQFTQASSGRYRATIGYGSYVGKALLIFPPGCTVESLQSLGIKIEWGEIEDTVYNPAKIDLRIDGWRMPLVEEWGQLFAMSGDLNQENIIKWVFSSGVNSELPYTGANIGEDLLGSRITASGHRQNGQLFNFFEYGKSAYFATHFDAERPCNEYSAPTVSLRRDGDAYGNHIICDDGNHTQPHSLASTRYWLRSIRFCRPLTDEELGYRLFVNEATDKIDVIAHTKQSPAIHPDNAPELEKGIIRGLALRYMSEDNTQILQPLSWFKSELEKTKDNGGYGWWYFTH